MMGYSYPEEAKTSLANEKGFFFFLNTWKNNERENYEKTFNLSLEAYSSETDRSFSLVTISDRKTLADIESQATESERIMEEYLFAKDQINNSQTRTINIFINIDTICMVLLEKIHILELQSGKNALELEKIFEMADIDHL